MLQIEYRLKLGQDEFTIRAEVKDEKEFFETMAFYSSLPKVAPGGSNDLKLTFRTTTEGHKYYSLVSEIEKKEYKFGQAKENNGGGLFPKGWADLYQAGGDGQQSFQQQAPPAFAQQATQFPGMVNPTNGPSAVPQFQQPAFAPPQPVQGVITPQTSPQAAQVPPAVAQVASNVLARFGVNKQ